MKTRKIFPLLLTLVLLVSIFGVFPASAAPQHMLSNSPIKGRQAIPVKAQGTNAGINYGLFDCQTGQADPWVCYDPFQMRRAYGIDTLINQGYDGAGRTIVIIAPNSSNTLESDLDAFDSMYGLPPRSAFFTQIAPFGLPPYDYNWASLLTLDVEWAHAIAPGAHIVLLLTPSTDAGVLSGYQYAVAHNLGDVIPYSGGETEFCIDPSIVLSAHRTFVQATQKHITLLGMSGNEGAAQPTCGAFYGYDYTWIQAVQYPGSDPLVTAVGGTELHAAKYCLPEYGCNPATNPLPGTWQSEVTWNEPDFGVASGGGFSTIFAAPPFQHLGAGRGMPDVAYNAAVQHGVLVYFSDPYYGTGWWLFGGTSAGTPQWGGLVAIADQIAGRPLGYINKALYTFGTNPGRYPYYFHDITVGNNSVVEYDSDGNPVAITGWDAVPGWDAATGLGSPIATLLFYLPGAVKDQDAQLAIEGSNPHLPVLNGKVGR